MDKETAKLVIQAVVSGVISKRQADGKSVGMAIEIYQGWRHMYEN